MKDDLTEQMIKAMEEKLRAVPHVETPFGTVYGVRSQQEVDEMDERIDIYNSLLRQQEKQEAVKELYRVYYKMVEAWYRWLIADAHACAINPRPKRTYASDEPAWLRRFVLKQIGPNDTDEAAITAFIGIYCPWENFGSSDIPAAKSLGWYEEIRSRDKCFRAMVGQKNSSLPTSP